MRPGPLSVDDVAGLVDDLGVPLHRWCIERLHRHTAGHPLYLRSVLGELTPTQLAAPGDDLPTPSSLALTTVGRMADLSAEARALGSALAVLRQRAPLPMVAAVAGLNSSTAALEELVASGFVTWTPGEAGTPVEFVHPLYSAAVYEDLSPSRRQQLHRAAASVLERGAALEHRFRATDTFDDGLAAELEAAAASLAGDGDLGTAATYLSWSSMLSAGVGNRERRLEEAVWWLLSGAETARAAALRNRLEACAESTRRDQLLGALAWDEGNAVESEKWLRRAVARGRSRGRPGGAGGGAGLAGVSVRAARADGGGRGPGRRSVRSGVGGSPVGVPGLGCADVGAGRPDRGGGERRPARWPAPGASRGGGRRGRRPAGAAGHAELLRPACRGHHRRSHRRD